MKLLKRLRFCWSVLRGYPIIAVSYDTWDRLLSSMYPPIWGTGNEMSCHFCGATWHPNADGVYEGKHHETCTAETITRNTSAEIKKRGTIIYPCKI